MGNPTEIIFSCFIIQTFLNICIQKNICKTENKLSVSKRRGSIKFSKTMRMKTSNNKN